MSTDTEPSVKNSGNRFMVPWNPWLAVLVSLFVFIFAQVAGVFIVSIYPAAKHWTIKATDNWLTNDITAQFFLVLLGEGLILPLLMLFVRLFHTSLRVIGLVKPKLEDIAYMLLGLLIFYPSYIGLAILLKIIFPKLNPNQSQQIGFQNPVGHAQLLLVFVSLVIIPPIFEEILFRGFLYTSLRKKLPVLISTLAVSVLFAVPHLLEGGSGGLLWIGGILTFVLSLVLCWLREKTGRLYAGMGLHAISNLVAFISLYGLSLFRVH